MKRTNCKFILITFIIIMAMVGFASSSSAQNKPNILVIWGDDIGQSNISAYTRGLVGYKTPNIDRIAKEGIIFTDYYGEQSCTAGRASFMLGQSVFPHRAFEGRAARCQRRHQRLGPHDRCAHERPGLRHRPVRQEPLR